MRLRQVAFAARDLDAVVSELRAALGIEVAFNDPGVGVFGLRNAVLPVDDTFFEVVSPVQADTAAGRYMARRGGDCGYMVMVQSEDSDLDRRRAAELAVRVAWSVDLDDIRGTHLHPRDLGGALLSLDTAVPPSAWRWAGPDWESRRRTEIAGAIVGVEMQCAERDAVASRWAALLGRPLQDGPDGSRRIALDQGELRFVTGPPGADGVTVVDVAATGARSCRDAVVICGTRIRFV
jgi:Glyoxalase-like domain